MNLKHFSLSEFDSPDEQGSGREHMDKRFVKMLDEAREQAGVPFIISSGYRTDAYNKQVGGVDDSAHTKGLAADIVAREVNEWDVLHGCFKAGIPRIGFSDDGNFVHCDIDDSKPSPRVWTY